MEGELLCVVGEVFKMRGCDGIILRGCCINGDNSGRFSCGSTVVAVDGVVVILTMGGLCSSGDDSGGCSFSPAAETSVTADVVVDVVVVVAVPVLVTPLIPLVAVTLDGVGVVVNVVVLVLTITLSTLVIAGDLQVALVSKI